MIAYITKVIQEKHWICKPKATKEGKQFHSAVWEMPKSNNIYEINVLPLRQKKKKVLNCYNYKLKDQNNN